MHTISNKNRAIAIGVFMVAAYSMLAYSVSKNIVLGFITDMLSGFAVIGIPVLLFPLFNSKQNKLLNNAYVISRFTEGILMVIGGICILHSSLEPYRALIYSNIHIYFFISGAIFFYVLLYRTQIIPRYISIWGFLATLLLLAITILKIFGINSPVFQILLIPIILNELYLAVWLMIKGFKTRHP